MNWLSYTLAALVVLLCGLLIASPATFKKFELYGRSVYFYFVAYDAVDEKVPPPMTWSVEDERLRTNKRNKLRILFIRHGHSTTNSLRGYGNDPEWWMFFTDFLRREVLHVLNPYESGWLDGALSDRGLAEAHDLRFALNDHVLEHSSSPRRRGSPFTYNPNTTALISSNIRRAIETAATGLQDVVKGNGSGEAGTKAKILMDPSLQEVNALSFHDNEDYTSLLPVPIRMAKERATHRSHDTITTPLKDTELFSPKFNSGNRDTKTNVWRRHDNFIKNLFGLRGCAGESGTGHTPAAPGSVSHQLEQAIVVGHSGWLRRFIARHLPSNSTHPLKNHLIRNCAAVVMDLDVVESAGGGFQVEIDDESIAFVHREMGRRD